MQAQEQGPGELFGGVDLVTIALAFVALIAVAGLIPLYIIVLQAWNV